MLDLRDQHECVAPKSEINARVSACREALKRDVKLFL